MALSQIPASTFNSLVAPGLCVADPGLPACSKVGANGHQLELTPIGGCSGWGRSIHGKTQVVDTWRFVKTCNMSTSKRFTRFSAANTEDRGVAPSPVCFELHPSPGVAKRGHPFCRGLWQSSPGSCPPPVSRACSSSPSLPRPFPQRAQTHHNFLAA